MEAFAATLPATLHTPRRRSTAKVMEALNVELMVEHKNHASALQLEHKPIADVKWAESVQQLKLSITSGLKDLSAAARAEAESHSDPLTLLRFLLARPTTESCA